MAISLCCRYDDSCYAVEALVPFKRGLRAANPVFPIRDGLKVLVIGTGCGSPSLGGLVALINTLVVNQQ